MNNNRTKAAVLGGVLAGGAALTLLSPAAPALADSEGFLARVNVQSSATLVGRGAAIDVPVEVQCSVPYVTVDIRVTERVGSQIARGYAYQEVACTGDPQMVVIRVEAISEKAFTKGPAVASANLYVCNGYTCITETTSATIKITK